MAQGGHGCSLCALRHRRPYETEIVDEFVGTGTHLARGKPECCS
jgi:hypothetical protein